ncbi:MAG: hypothetical protein ACOC1K_01045 [Nanoarchaeota archaeon]
MENWLKKNLKYVTIAFVFLFLFKSFQSCNRNATIRIQEKKLTSECDSIVNYRNSIINQYSLVVDSMEKELITKEFIIKDLTSELKIAGVKVDEAERRSQAVQRTAERVKYNTIIEFKGVEKDTLRK